MAGLTPYAEGKALDLLLRGTAYTAPASVHAGLFTTAPADDGSGGVEVAISGYARQTIAFGAYAARQIANSNAPSWFAAAAWGSVPALGIWDAASGGNLLAAGPISPVPSIGAGTSFALAAGQVVVDVAKLGPFLAQQVLELLFKATAKTQLPTLTAKLYTAAPSDDGAGGTELAASGYAAQAATWAAYSPVNKRCNLAADISFTTAAPATWGALAAAGYFSGANFLGQGPIVPAPNVAAGAPFALSAPGSFLGFAD